MEVRNTLSHVSHRMLQRSETIFSLNGKNLMFSFSGPAEPKNYVPDSPSTVKKNLFKEDSSPISESDEDDSTASYVSKVTTKKVFKFRDISKVGSTSTKKNDSPTSSPILLPSPTASTIIISSDEELENSMIALEERISLEMSSSD